MTTAIDVDTKATELEEATPQDTLKWALSTLHPRIILASSFGPEDIVLMHMAKDVEPDTHILFLETGFHFPETEELKARLRDEWKLNLKEYKRAVTALEFYQELGDRPFDKDPERCCGINKVEPLRRALSQYEAWITGMRREQSPTRANIKIVEQDGDNRIKINPLARWTKKEVWGYIHDRSLPYNPLHDQHYPSVGCFNCTRPVMPGEDERAGRWAGQDKTECGLHTFEGDEAA